MITVNKDHLQELADSLEESYKLIEDELTNVRQTGNPEIDILKLRKEISGMRIVLDELFSLEAIGERKSISDLHKLKNLPTKIQLVTKLQQIQKLSC